MVHVELNIGLNNNPQEFNEIAVFFINNYGAKVQRQIGQFEGAVEPTVVTVFSVPFDYPIIQKIEEMCKRYTQQCIAAKLNYDGILIYHPEHTGEKYEYSDEYFLSFLNVEFKDEAKGTRGGFYHRSALIINGEEVSSARVSYVNRTYESYQFKTSRQKAYDKIKKNLPENYRFVIENLLNREG